jgi:hypothetical protein
VRKASAMLCQFKNLSTSRSALILSFDRLKAQSDFAQCQLYRQLVGRALVLSECGFTDVIENMERENGLPNPGAQLGKMGHVLFSVI